MFSNAEFRLALKQVLQLCTLRDYGAVLEIDTRERSGIKRRCYSMAQREQGSVRFAGIRFKAKHSNQRSLTDGPALHMHEYGYIIHTTLLRR